MFTSLKKCVHYQLNGKRIQQFAVFSTNSSIVEIFPFRFYLFFNAVHFCFAVAAAAHFW